MRPAMWVSPVTTSERASWGTVLDSAQAQSPDASILSVNAPIHSAAAFDVVVEDDRGLHHIYVHPLTAEVTGEGAWISVQRFLRDSHRRIMIFETFMGVRIGILLVCLTSVYLLVNLITSFWIYKKWWRGFLRLPKGRDLRSYIGDLHRWMGLWSLWFVIVMCYTGLWYLQAEIVDYGPLPRTSVENTAASSDQGPSTLGAALDVAIANSQKVHLDFRLENIYLSGLQTDSPVFDIQGQTDRAILVDGRANSVLADANTGELLRASDASSFDLISRLRVANNPLHFGKFAGYWSKWIYFFSGLLLSALAISGALVYVLRLANKEKTEIGFRYFAKQAWNGMGLARWPALALTLFSFVALPFLY